MTVKELIKKLETFPEDHVVIINFDDGWSNIEEVILGLGAVSINAEESPVFSEHD